MLMRNLGSGKSEVVMGEGKPLKGTPTYSLCSESISEKIKVAAYCNQGKLKDA